ncbi:MAG: hypothetical protein R3F14_17160 [Polyangiaceae bacterium]
MDLKKLMAALQASASNAPLLSTSTYVPPTSDAPDEDRDAARRMIAAFVHWLARGGHTSDAGSPARKAILDSILARPDQPEKVIEELGDNVYSTDVAQDQRDFATGYLAPFGEGNLGDDYFKLFVEATGGRTMRDARPTPAEYNRFSDMIDARERGFAQGAPDWKKPLAVPNAPRPTSGQAVRSKWLARLPATPIS